MDDAVAADLSKLEEFFALKREQRGVLKAFHGGKNVSALPPNGFGKSLVKHCNALRFTTEQYHVYKRHRSQQ